MRELIVNGVPLRDPRGQWFIDYTRSTFFTAISRRFESEARVGFNGVITAKDTYFTSGQGTVVLSVQGATAEEFNQNVQALQALFNLNTYRVVAAPQKTPLLGQFDDDQRVRSNRSFDALSAVLREASMRTVGSIALERIGSRAGRLTIIMEKPGAFWLGVGSYDQQLLEGRNNLSIAADSTAPITSAKLRIKGPFADGGYVEIRDRGRTDKTVRVTPPFGFAVSQYLLVYLDTMQAWTQANDSWVRETGAVDARSSISTSGSGSFSFEGGTVLTNFPLVSQEYYLGMETVGMGIGITNPATVFLNIRRSYLS